MVCNRMKPLPEIERYKAAADEVCGLAAPLDEVRFVALDTESTGLDPIRDVLISMGAVGVQGRVIDIGDSFETVLPVGHNTATVVIHGITREASLAGMPEPEALCALLDMLRGDVIVGHHIGHDLAMLNGALEKHFGVKLHNRCVDTGTMAFWLDTRHQQKTGHTLFQSFTLDGLCEHFGLTAHDRHTATGDAFLTAQVFLKLIVQLRTVGITTLGDLLELENAVERYSAGGAM